MSYWVRRDAGFVRRKRSDFTIQEKTACCGMGDNDVDFGDNNVRGNMSGGFDLRDSWLGR